MNPNSGGSRDVVELWGRQFNLVKNGLSEAQVVSFVNDLAKQHDVLLQRNEHLSALTKLAERTVSEADKLAVEMKEEAIKEGKAEAVKAIAEAEKNAKDNSERVIAEAKERADTLVKEREEQVMASATKEAEKIRTNAEQTANQIKEDAQAEANRLVKEAEARGRHISEQKEAEAIESATNEAKKIIAAAQREASTMLEREKMRVQPEIAHFIRDMRGRLMDELENIRMQATSLESRFQMPGGTSEQSTIDEHAEKSDALMELVGNNNQVDTGEPEWEVEIVPPIDIMKIMNIVSYLDSLPEVVRTEIIPRNDRTSVTVYTDRPVTLLNLIKDLPEVGHAEETTSGDGGKMKKITLALSTTTENANPLPVDGSDDPAK
jgi:cell division septum initiation protein DivIVA